MILEDLTIHAYEAFIRRAAELNLPFMLKGSFLTRQYFPDPQSRIPQDLDWLYLKPIDNLEDSKQIFDNWTTQVTDLTIHDGVKFRSFSENAFWRRIEYAMSDDFPTVNTDLLCWVDGEVFNYFSMDISFNLDIEVPPTPLLYKPMRGESFTISYSTPIALQVAWKIHQTLVRPRFKDLFDLIYLVQHPSFDEEALSSMLQALVNECAVDKTEMYKVVWFLKYEFEKLFLSEDPGIEWLEWLEWRSDGCHDFAILLMSAPMYDQLPNTYGAFKTVLNEVLYMAGISVDLIDSGKIPQPNRSKPRIDGKQKKRE
jgi:hypothetical protein